MKAAVLSIGTELTRGEISNTNATWLCEQLTQLGARVDAVLTVDDDLDRIQNALRQLADLSDVVVCTGGLGPTTDDLTAVAVAQLLGVPLETDIESLDRIRRLVEQRGRVLTPSNAKQADLPRGATVLSNPEGTAPGFSVHIRSASHTEGCEAFFMPGVPREMRALFTQHIAGSLAGRLSDTATHQEQLRVFGMPESIVNDALAGVEAEFNVTVGYRAHFPEVFVKALAVRSSMAEARSASVAAANEIERRLGDKVYARGDTSLVSVVGSLLHHRSWTLGLAESCTGGLVATMITAQPASHFFVGGVVSYADEVKRRVLGVQRRTLELQGAVSEAAVKEMAEGVRDALNCDVGLAFSGIAGPTGGTDAKPVGLVHYSVSTPRGTVTRHQIFSGDRGQIQLRAAFSGLDLLRCELM